MTNPLELIDTVKKTKIKYDTIAKYTAVNFNVFKILDVSSKEVKLHSTFLAELLNPQGSHMQGDIFLNIFLEEFEVEMKWKGEEGNQKGFELENAVVNKEFWIENINQAYTQGGSIDILIRNKHQGIIIENKIYAIDQPNQLLRYYNFGVKAFKSENNFRILYLTLDSSLPSKSSTGNIEYYSCLSYRKHIINWLEKCLTVVYDFPLVFALIRQYLNHIKHLTNQSIFEKMKQEIKDEIKVNQEAFKTAREISNALLEIRSDLFNKITQHFDNYFIRSQKSQCILNSNINIILSNDSQDGYWVGLAINKEQSEGLNIDHIKEIAIAAGGSNGNTNYLTWYSLKTIPYNLDTYSDDEVYPLLQDEKLIVLYKEIDIEIGGFLEHFNPILN